MSKRETKSTSKVLIPAFPRSLQYTALKQSRNSRRAQTANMSNSAERDTDMANGEADEESGDEQDLLLGGLDKLVIVRDQFIWGRIILTV